MKTSTQSVLLIVVLFFAARVASADDPITASHEPGNHEITLEQAIETALRLNPTLAAFAYGVSAAQARLDQASLYPNPEFDFEAENFGGSGELGGFSLAETTFAFSQPILLGGKIAGRKGVAGSDHALATRDLEAVRLDVVAQTTIAFNNVIVNQENVRLTEELFVVAESFADTVRARVEAGKVSPVEGIRAKTEAARTRVEVAKATRELSAARVRLASTWGSSNPRFTRAIGQLPRSNPPPPVDVLKTRLEQTPEIVRLADEVRRQEQVVKLEESLGVPDLTLTVGPRHFRETGGWAWVGGLSLELPVFDRNQGARRAAEFELERTRREIEAERTALESRLVQVLERLRAVSEEARLYEEEIIPASAEAFDAMLLGFREGKFGFLEVLDAQRTLFEARLLLLDSQQRYATARAQLDRLIGQTTSPEAKAASGGVDLGQGDPQ